jgi:hypothetical protein
MVLLGGVHKASLSRALDDVSEWIQVTQAMASMAEEHFVTLGIGTDVSAVRMTALGRGYNGKAYRDLPIRDARCTATVTVVDRTPPAIACPSNQLVCRKRALDDVSEWIQVTHTAARPARTRLDRHRRCLPGESYCRLPLSQFSLPLERYDNIRPIPS